jgi:CHAT domain-containing protein
VARIVTPEQVTVLTGPQAREQAVRAAVPEKSVIHFATHGILKEDDPSESFIALSGSAGEPASDGRLTAAEVYQLDLNADLVVLSACRSALGSVSSDGIIGLTRAFFYAGASSVLATLWDVADAPTSRLTAEFYRSYRRDQNKSRALRQAQLRLISALRSGRVRVSTPLGQVTVPEEPLFWAGFALVGEP